MVPLLISREVDYALRILRTLSQTHKITASEICARESIPQQFAYKILRKLSGSDFVAITRGPDGGCKLIADLHDKSLYDLICAVDSLQLVNACMQPGFLCVWQQKHGESCTIHHKLCEIQSAIDSELQSHSIASLLEPIPL